MAAENKQTKPQNTPKQNRSASRKSTQGGRSVSKRQPSKPAADKRNNTAKRKTNTSKTQTGKRNNRKKNTAPALPVKITCLGGLNEIGKNITLIEYGNDAFLIDCGMAFPDSDMLGVDIVLPDFSHILKNRDRIRGVVLTHGHEDHIGGLPYLLKECNFPIFGTRLTLALVNSKLKEHGLADKAHLQVVNPGDSIPMGEMSVELIAVNHSIPDAVGLAIKTPAGYIVHTGDFKIDFTPISGEVIDLARFGELGKQGVLALMADSTNAERPGFTPSERVVGESFAKLFSNAKNRRIIIATFSSNLHRIQQIVDAARRDGRKVAVSGRSMINYVTIAKELGYLDLPDGLMIDIEAINRYPKEKVIIVTTGSQGEPMSALTRMAFSDHRQVEVGPDDYIIISATPIPGNEKAVTKVVNELMRRGCNVVYEKMYDVHTSGHACQEELKIIHTLTKPQYFIPVHGEQKHLHKSVELAKALGMTPDRVLISDIGKVIELTSEKMVVSGTVQAGRVLVDGLGVGDVGSIVLRDRRHLAEDGILVIVATINSQTGELVSGPDIVSRGFVYVRESEQLMDQARELARKALETCIYHNPHDWNTMKVRVRDELSRMLFQKTKKSPIILPIIMDI